MSYPFSAIIVKVTGTTRLPSAPEFQSLGEVPREVEWFKNIRKDLLEQLSVALSQFPM